MKRFIIGFIIALVSICTLIAQNPYGTSGNTNPNGVNNNPNGLNNSQYPMGGANSPNAGNPGAQPSPSPNSIPFPNSGTPPVGPTPSTGITGYSGNIPHAATGPNNFQFPPPSATGPTGR